MLKKLPTKQNINILPNMAIMEKVTKCQVVSPHTDHVDITRSVQFLACVSNNVSNERAVIREQIRPHLHVFGLNEEKYCVLLLVRYQKKYLGYMGKLGGKRKLSNSSFLVSQRNFWQVFLDLKEESFVEIRQENRQNQ